MNDEVISVKFKLAADAMMSTVLCIPNALTTISVSCRRSLVDKERKLRKARTNKPRPAKLK